MERYLYRGENQILYKKNCGRLKPKAIRRSFKRCIPYGEKAPYGGGRTYGESEANAAIAHQIDSSRYPSSGISTTPIFENAKRYATHKGQRGYVYKIRTSLLKSAGVKAYEVFDYVVQPAIPSDKEVILVASDCGELPDDIIVEIIEVQPTDAGPTPY